MICNECIAVDVCDIDCPFLIQKCSILRFVYLRFLIRLRSVKKKEQ